MGESLNRIHKGMHSDELLKMLLLSSRGVDSTRALETSLLPLLKTGTAFKYCQVTTRGTGYSPTGRCFSVSPSGLDDDRSGQSVKVTVVS